MHFNRSPGLESTASEKTVLPSELLSYVSNITSSMGIAFWNSVWTEQVISQVVIYNLIQNSSQTLKFIWVRCHCESSVFFNFLIPSPGKVIIDNRRVSTSWFVIKIWLCSTEFLLCYPVSHWTFAINPCYFPMNSSCLNVPFIERLDSKMNLTADRFTDYLKQ